MGYDQPLVLKLCRRLKTKASLSCLKLMNQTSQLGDIVASAEKSEDSTVLDQTLPEKGRKATQHRSLPHALNFQTGDKPTDVLAMVQTQDQETHGVFAVQSSSKAYHM